MKLCNQLSFIQLRLVLLALPIVYCEELLFNGTHLNVNQTKVEVTTVKIAEIVSLRNDSKHDSTRVIKEKTAKHFVTSTVNPKVVLIPPAKIDAQIVKKEKASAA